MDLSEFIEKMAHIKAMGWIQTHRAGNTGIGKTLEDLLGIAENNFSAPDFDTYELKSQRIKTQSMLTLFTKSPNPYGINKELLSKYGYVAENQKKILHVTLTSDHFIDIPFSSEKLKIQVIGDRLCIVSLNGETRAYWNINELKEIIQKKYPNNLVYVMAESKGKGETEEFFYKDALLRKGVSAEKIIQLVSTGKILIDIRMGQYPDGTTHDHGTAFRIKQTHFDELFSENQILI